MTNEEFRKLFLGALEKAASVSDGQLGVRVPRLFLIELHGAGGSGQRIGVDEALNHLFIDEHRFYKIIDVAIIAVLPRVSVAFVRVSGHAPVEFEATWNARELGPFKQLESMKIEH